MIIEGILAISIGALFILIAICCFWKKKEQGIDADELKRSLQELSARVFQLTKENVFFRDQVQKLNKVNFASLNKFRQDIVKTEFNNKILSDNLHNIKEQSFDFCLVIDKSSSMNELYNKGIVQDVFEKIFAIPQILSNDKICNSWAYASQYSRISDITENNIKDYIDKEVIPTQIGGGNNEVLVMEDILKKYINEDKRKNELIVLFITDGGISNGLQIRNIIAYNKDKPIFWQFIGVGYDDFSSLKEIKDIGNAGLSIIKDIQLPEEELYKNIFIKFPNWSNNRKS